MVGDYVGRNGVMIIRGIATLEVDISTICHMLYSST